MVFQGIIDDGFGSKDLDEAFSSFVSFGFNFKPFSAFDGLDKSTIYTPQLQIKEGLDE